MPPGPPYESGADDLRRWRPLAAAFQRDRTIELGVVRFVDVAHASGANPRNDAITLDAAADQVACGPLDQRRGRRFEKGFSLIVRDEQRLDLLSQERVRAAHVGEICGTSTRVEDDCRVENRLDARPGRWVALIGGPVAGATRLSPTSNRA